MPVRLTPVDEVSPKRWVDLVVIRSMREASIRDARFLEAGKDDIELVLCYSEAVVLFRNDFIALIEVDRQFLAHVNRGERPDCPLFGPSDTQQFGELPCSSHPVFGWHDQVVEPDGHGDEKLFSKSAA